MKKRIRNRLKRLPYRRMMSVLMTMFMAAGVFAVPVFAQAENESGKFPVTQYVTDLFTDVPAWTWYAEPIQKAYSLGLMNGVSMLNFSPETTMTRAMFVQVMYNLAGRPYMYDPTCPFKDADPDKWYFPAVCWAYDNHVVSGISPDQFAPEDCITREQAAKILYSYVGVTEKMDALSGFEDIDVINDWAVEGITWAVANGIMKGSAEYGVLYLRPRNNLKRSEAASMLSSFYEVTTHQTIEVNFPTEIHIASSQVKKGVKIPSLMYHEVSDNVWGLPYLFVSPSEMRSQISWLLKNGYDPIFYSDLTHVSDYDKPVLITFDDGYDGNYENLFPIIKEFNVKVTIFVVTDNIGKAHRMTAAQIREMSDSGLVSIQSHTHTHVLLDTLTADELVTEFQQSKTVISSITGKSPYVLSYPEGRSTAYAREIAGIFFSFGVQDRNGPWKTTSDLFQAKRVTIAREMTLSQFASVVKR